MYGNMRGIRRVGSSSGAVAVSISSASNYAGSFRNLQGGVSVVVITAYGSGYVTAPTISFTGGGGSGATAVASVSGGLLVAITVTVAGSGYTSAPTVVITGGSGTGAAATAHLATKAFESLDIAGSQAFYVDGTNTRVPTGKKLAVGNQIALQNTDFIVAAADTNVHRTMSDFQYINSYAGGSAIADVSTMRIFAQQLAGDSYNRPLEVHMLSNVGTSALPKLAIEATSQASYVGNGIDRTGVISMRNLADAWGIPTPQRLDFGLLIGGDHYGFTNGILYQDTIGAGSGTLFKVDQTGFVTNNGLIVQHTGAPTVPPAGSLKLVAQSDGKFYKVTPNPAGESVLMLDTDLFTGAGQMIYFTADETPASLAAGTTSQFLKGGTAPAFAAITQKSRAAGSTSGPTRLAATYAVIPEMAITLTTTGGDCEVFFGGTFSANGVVNYSCAIHLDGTIIGSTQRTVTETNSGYFQTLTISHLETSLAAGSHTFDVRWISDGVSTVTAATTQRSMHVVEFKG